MATLRVELGPLSAEVTADDATAATMVEGYLRAYGLWSDGQTNAQRLRAFMRRLGQHVQEASDSVAVREAVEARRAELQAERASLHWQ